MSLETGLRNTTCSKGHTHPPWNTTGVLRIAKCESVCGFCQKETKTAANLRKHVAIHIKNERLNLSIAEGSSGRGRLEMPMVRAESSVSSSSRVSVVEDEDPMDTESTPSYILTSMARRHHLTPSTTYSTHASSEFSPSAALLAMRQSQPHSQSPPRATTSSPTTPYTLSSHSSPHTSRPLSTPNTQSLPQNPYASFSPQEISEFGGLPHVISEWTGKTLPTDPYKHLRRHNIGTKPAWIAIPASEGFRILDLCKSMSTAALAVEGKVPCYNRETLFDEEWQAHMKDVHGVFLLWPETWMRRIEVLDLDAFGGDIVAVNEVIMDS